MKITRRDVLKLAAGSAVGLMFTPVPWKTLDDTAIWTQNWPWIPQPLTGEATVALTSCTLCPAGCGVRARCIKNIPVRLNGMEGHPYGNGSLCPVGLAGHHLPCHPARVRQPLQRIHNHGRVDAKPIAKDEACSLIARAIRENGNSVAVLDRRPGRSISLVYRQWLGGLAGGIYLAAPPAGDATARMTARMCGYSGTLGYDLEHARTILSFGTPLFDGWGTPGRMARLETSRSLSGSPVIIQIESRRSRTALKADRWIPVKPGSEGTFALSLAHVLLRDKLTPVQTADTQAYGQVIASFSPESTASVTGVAADTVTAMAHLIAGNLPALVIGGDDPAAGSFPEHEQMAIAGLNILLGSAFSTGGLVPRRPAPGTESQAAPLAQESRLHQIPDGSLGVLILDGAEDGCALPWEVIERKLRGQHSLVVSLSPFLTGLARRADVIVPAPAPLEAWDDLPAPADAPANSLSVVSPLLPAPEGAVDPVSFVRGLAEATGVQMSMATSEEVVKQQIAAVQATRRGIVVQGTSQTALNDIDSSDRLLDMLSHGGVWLDEPATTVSPKKTFCAMPPDQTMSARLAGLAGGSAPASGSNITVVPLGWKGTAATGLVSPLLSKLFQESNLRPLGNNCFGNPETLRTLGFSHGDRATLSNERGTLAVVLHHDASVMPGLLYVAVSPDPAAMNNPAQPASDIFTLCATDDCTWRIGWASLGRA